MFQISYDAINPNFRALKAPPQGRAKAALNPPVGGGASQNGGLTFYFTTATLKVGIVDQC